MSPKVVSKKGAGLALALALLAGTTAAPANADTDSPQAGPPPIDLTSQQEASIRAEFQRFGVDPSDQDALIHGLETGEEWDSSTDVAPASVSNQVIDGIDYTISRYEDGSFLAAGLEVPQAADPNARAIQSCATSGTSAGVAYRTKCLIIVTNGATSAQFRASISWWASGTSIYDVGAGFVNSDVGVVSAGNFSSSTAPGTTKWTQFNWTTTIDGWYQATRYVRLTLSTGGPSTSSNY